MSGKWSHNLQCILYINASHLVIMVICIQIHQEVKELKQRCNLIVSYSTQFRDSSSKYERNHTVIIQPFNIIRDAFWYGTILQDSRLCSNLFYIQCQCFLIFFLFLQSGYGFGKTLGIVKSITWAHPHFFLLFPWIHKVHISFCTGHRLWGAKSFNMNRIFYNILLL